MPIRPIRVVGDVAYVPLTRGYEAVIDAADVPLVEPYNWKAKPAFNRIYAYSSKWDSVNKRKVEVIMHRIINGTPAGYATDHIDLDTLNNRRSNLRTATNLENARNKAISPHNTTGYKGVAWDKRIKKWIARIRDGQRQRHLGVFSSPLEAYAAYCQAAKEIHGNFARFA
jgi:hypothetical protein